MSEILVGASLAASFIAGIAALFAPCCITVLLPVYLGSIFRQRRTVLLMTFVFFLGLLTVFLPLGLGVSALGELFREFHDLIFISGSAFLIVLGTSILFGKHFSMPFQPKSQPKVSGAASVFALGIFSGFATLCCAPVLAGILTLAVLPGSIFLGGLYSVAYVLGMTLPLFAIAYFIDRNDALKKIGAFNRVLSYRVFGKEVSLRLSDFVAGTTFILMGLLTFYLSATGQLFQKTESQIFMNMAMESANRFIGGQLPVPDIAWTLAIIALLAAVVFLGLREWKRKNGSGKIDTGMAGDSGKN